MSSCIICLNDIVHKASILACPACEKESCHSCLQSYFETISEPKCPNCFVLFTRDFLAKSCQKFMLTFKKKRETFLLEQELSKLPESQPFVEVVSFARASEVDIKAWSEREDELKRELQRLKEQKQYAKELVSQVKSKEYGLATANMQNLKRLREEDESGLVSTSLKKDDKKGQDVPLMVICPCPVDDCRGFVMTTAVEGTLSCGVCQVLVCGKCLVVTNKDALAKDALAKDVLAKDALAKDALAKDALAKDVAVTLHVCNPDQLASAIEIKKSSKPCPKCSAPISKIDGCDQMWCVQCKTAFSYASGKVVNGPVHNPHYYEWLRKNSEDGAIPRAVGDNLPAVDCQRLPDFQRIYYSFDKETNLAYSTFFQNVHRFIGEIVTEYIDGASRPTQPNNSDARVAFLRKEIDEAELGRIAQRRDKEYSKKMELFNIFDTFKIAGIEILRRCVKPRESINLVAAELLKQELFTLIEFSNENLKSTAKVYSSKLKQITLFKRGEWKGPEMIEAHPIDLQVSWNLKDTYFKLV